MAISKLLRRILVFRCFFFLFFFSFYLLHDLAASLKMLFNSPFFYQYDNESCTSFTTLSHQRMKTKNNLRRIRVYTEVLTCNFVCSFYVSWQTLFIECLITNRSAKITFLVNKTLRPLYANFRFSLSNRPFVENDTILQQKETCN